MNFHSKYFLFVAVIFSGCSENQNEISTGVLVSTDWIQNQMIDSSIELLHVGTWEVFDSVHIQGARYIDPYEFTLTTDSLRNELPKLNTIEDLLRSVGVNMDSRIVLYFEDERMISHTARVFMTLDYAGLGSRTFVLNGGLPVWIEEERKVTRMKGNSPGDSGPRPVKKEAKAIDGDLNLTAPREVVVRANELNQLRWDPDYVIVDTRSLEEYLGEIDSSGVHASRGHIEGAYFMDYESVFSESNPHKFLGDEELLKTFKISGVEPDKKAIYYCGSGMRASVSYLAARHLGFSARLYDGAYEEWVALDLPLTFPVIDPSDIK